MGLLKKGREAKKKISKVAFSKFFIGLALSGMAVAFTIVYSLVSVGWDPRKVGWSKMVWQTGIIVGLYVVGLFVGWILEGQNVRDDETSDYCLAKRDYSSMRAKIDKDVQYFDQFYYWEKSREIVNSKIKSLLELGWKAKDSAPSDSLEVVNASAEEIAKYATPFDLAQATKEEAIKVDHKDGHAFYISKIGEELSKKTIKILERDEGIDFCEANYYLTDSEIIDPKPMLANGKYIKKKTEKKAKVSVLMHILSIAVWGLILAGAVIENSYAGSTEAWMNAISRLSAHFGGILGGMGVVDSYINGLADMLKDKINVLGFFFNCVVMDRNFVPDTSTKTAKEIYDWRIAKEKKEEEERLAESEARRKQAEADRAEAQRKKDAYRDYLENVAFKEKIAKETESDRRKSAEETGLIHINEVK